MTYNKNRSDGNTPNETTTNEFIPPGTVYPDDVVAWPGEITAYMGDGTIFPDDGTVWIENIVIDPNDW